MFAHHQAAIHAVTEKLKARDEILGVILGGSVAHGFAEEKSDIDIMLVVSDADFDSAMESLALGYFERESTPYEGGYVDGKYVSPGFIRKVGEYGCEPARFAFQGAQVTYSKMDGLYELVQNAARYPEENRIENMIKFYAQLETWRWYYYEGEKRGNRFLSDYCINNYVLSAGRLILLYNRLLYPSYKWFLKVLESAEHKPDGFLEKLMNAVERKDGKSVEELYKCTATFQDWYPSQKHFSVQFMLDSQLNWLDGMGGVPVLDR